MSSPGWAAADTSHDAIVIGSGFGGAMAARVLIEAGWSVLMLERGDWVERSAESWSAGAVGPLTPHYSTESPYHLKDDSGDTNVGAFHCVGGPSVFYGGVAFRFRAEDFESTRRSRVRPPHAGLSTTLRSSPTTAKRSRF